MIGRYVGRARGRALRAAGLPRVPNTPSGRALARRELREAARVARPVARVGTTRSAGTNGPTARRRHRTDDVGTLPAVIALLGVVVAVWLLVATGVPDARPTSPSDCVDRVVYQHARLRDC